MSDQQQPGQPSYPGDGSQFGQPGGAYGQPHPGYGVPAGYGSGYGAGQGQSQGRSNGLGLTSMILGIVGIFPFPIFFIPSILAVIFGFIGRGKARRGEASNGGQALAGLIMGFLGLALGITFWAFAIANAHSTNCSTVSTGNGQYTTTCHRSG